MYQYCVIMPKIWCIKYHYVSFLLKMYLNIHFHERSEIWLEIWLERLRTLGKMGIRELAKWFKYFYERHEIGVWDWRFAHH